MKYKSPKLTVDGIILNDKQILLIKRNIKPFKDRWALPGGHVEYGERVEDAAVREILEETGLKVEIKSLFGVYSDPDRDPRGHTVTVVFLMNVLGGKLEGGDDAADARFFELNNIPELAFDHNKILDDCIRRLK